jgi:flagellar protein FliO/FliZ
LIHLPLYGRVVYETGRGQLKTHTFTLLLVCCLLVSLSPLLGQEGDIDPEQLILIGEGDEEASDQSPVLTAWDFIRMLLILGAVVAAIYIIFRLIKRGAARRLTERELIRLLDSRSLSGNRALHLVEVGNSIYLVGSAESGVALVAELTDKESLDRVRLELSQKPEQERAGFSKLLTGLLKPGSKENIPVNQTINFMKRQQERLKKLRQA